MLPKQPRPCVVFIPLDWPAYRYIRWIPDEIEPTHCEYSHDGVTWSARLPVSYPSADAAASEPRGPRA